MKKIKAFFTIAICGLFFLSIAMPQEITGKGFKGGLNMAKFTGKDADLGGSADNKFALNYSLGGYLTFKLNDQLSLQPELLYTVKGSKYELSENYSDEDFSIDMDVDMDLILNYLEFPVLAVYHHKKNVNVFGGLYFAYFMKGEMKSSGSMSITEYGVTETESLSETEDISKSEIDSGFGIIFGGTYYFKENLGIEVRYSKDFKTIDNEPDDWDDYDDGEYEKGDIKNTGFQILLTYSL
jgi:hypothetical protein